MKIILLIAFLGSSWTLGPQVGYIYNSCVENNNLNLTQSPGGTLYFSVYDQNSSKPDYGLMNNTHIINCLVVLQVLPQGTLPYQRFLGFHFRLWNFDTNSGTRYDSTLTNLYFPNASAAIRNACGDVCATGCMQVVHPTYGTIVSLCGANQLTGSDYSQYFQENFLFLRFYLLGGLYNFSGNINYTILSRSTTNFIIDYYSFYFGKCTDTTTEFQCVNTDRCIDISLRCDYYGGMDCGVPKSGGVITYDQINCTTTSTTTTTTLLALLAILALPLFIFLLIWCFYRPGICCWRCARLRNCPGCDSKCYRKCCVHPIVMGTGTKACNCCRYTPKLKKSNTTACCMCCSPTPMTNLCCCKNKENNTNDEKNTFNDPNDKYEKEDTSFGWANYASGDGYHLRECR